MMRFSRPARVSCARNVEPAHDRPIGWRSRVLQGRKDEFADQERGPSHLTPHPLPPFTVEGCAKDRRWRRATWRNAMRPGATRRNRIVKCAERTQFTLHPSQRAEVMGEGGRGVERRIAFKKEAPSIQITSTIGRAGQETNPIEANAKRCFQATGRENVAFARSRVTKRTQRRFGRPGRRGA
jgi:hypothetical protein